MIHHIRGPIAMACVIAMLLASCRGSSSSSSSADVQVANDLSPGTITLRTAPDQIQIAHPLRLEVEIHAVQEAVDVPVEIGLLSKADVDAGRDEITQFTLGTSVIPTLLPGTTRHLVELVVPETLDPPGDYYVVCHVDPQDVVPESDDGNNHPDETAARRVTVNVRGTRAQDPDLVLEHATPDEKVVALHPVDDGDYPSRDGTTDQKNHHFGITALISTTGKAPVADVGIQVLLGIDRRWVPLGLWDGDADQARGYGDTLTIESLGFEEPVSVQLCVRVPDAVRQEIVQLVGSAPFRTFPVEVIVDPDDQIPEYEDSVTIAGRKDDNRVRLDLMFARPDLPTLTKDKDLRKEYHKEWRKSLFGIGVHHETRLAAGKEEFRVESVSYVPVTMFGQTFEFLRFVGDGYGEVESAGESIQPDEVPLDYRLEFAGTTIYRPGIGELRAKGTLDFWVKKDFPVDDRGRKGFRKKFIVHGVPIIVQAWATGRLGARATLATRREETTETSVSELGLKFVPYVSIGVSATGKADLGIVRPGVGTSLELLREQLVFSAGGRLTATKTAKPTVVLDLDYGLTNEIYGPNGKFFVFVEYPRYRFWRKKRWRKASRTLVRWRTFVKRDVLINKQESLLFNE